MEPPLASPALDHMATATLTLSLLFEHAEPFPRLSAFALISPSA